MLPCVFLHGFLGTKEDWDPVFSFLPKFERVAIDLPGHSHSPFTEHFTLPYSKMHLIGYSMGGRLAMQFAAANPEKIASLTILSAHCGMIDEQEKEKRLEQDLVWAQKITHSFDDFLREWYDQSIFAGFRPDLTERKKHDPKSLAQALIAYSLGKQPVFNPKNACIVVGEKDRKYRELYPDAIVVPNAGHMVHYEQPALVAEIIKDRLDRYRELH